MTTLLLQVSVVCCISSLWILSIVVGAAASSPELLDEALRIQEYEKRNFTWPPTTFVPNTPGWSQLYRERLEQIARMKDTGRNRYLAYHSTVHSALLCPNYTVYGFGLSRAPDDLVQDLQQVIQDGWSTAGPEPYHIDHIVGPQPLFIEGRYQWSDVVLKRLQPYAEKWSNIKLKGWLAYGFRLYQNNSQLLMHTDRKSSHVISLIVHLDRSRDAAAWPLVIEDFDGRTHAVALELGEMLFYESSKVFHGRPIPFQGSWYTSLFVHYRPATVRRENPERLAHYRIPPEWTVRKPQPSNPRLTMAGHAFVEPDCPNLWCRTQSAIAWNPQWRGEHGVWIAPNGRRIPLQLLPDEESDEL